MTSEANNLVLCDYEVHFGRPASRLSTQSQNLPLNGTKEHQKSNKTNVMWGE
jgi:hypothetical protein